MTRPKLGLIGGLGVGATMHYYREIVAAMQARDRTANLCIAHAESSVVTGLALAGRKLDLADYLAPFVESLARAGATFAALPALTPHFAFEDLRVRVSIPLLDARRSIRTEIMARKLRRIAVFGTRPTIESRIFGALEVEEAVGLDESDVGAVHDIYYSIVKSGDCPPPQRAALVAIAHRLVVDRGAEAIAFAGTDLSLAFSPGDLDFPVIDCAALQIDDIVRTLAGDIALPD